MCSSDLKREKADPHVFLEVTAVEILWSRLCQSAGCVVSFHAPLLSVLSSRTTSIAPEAHHGMLGTDEHENYEYYLYYSNKSMMKSQHT